MQGPGTFSNIIARIVQIIGGAGTGLFVYSPTAALGNLVASIVASAGTDPYTNPYKAGITVYGSGGATDYIQMQSGNPSFIRFGTGDSAESSAASLTSQISGSGPTRQFISTHQAARVTGQPALSVANIIFRSPSVDLTTSPPSVSVQAASSVSIHASITVTPTGVSIVNTSFPSPSALTVTNGLVADFVNITSTLTATGGTSSSPSLVTTDTWQTYTLINSFTGTLNYRLCADGTVEVYGSVTTPAAGFNFVNINNAPAAVYGALQTPAINPPLLCYDNNAGSIVLAKVFGNGQIQFVNAVASHLIVFNGRYPQQ